MNTGKELVARRADGKTRLRRKWESVVGTEESVCIIHMYVTFKEQTSLEKELK